MSDSQQAGPHRLEGGIRSKRWFGCRETGVDEAVVAVVPDLIAGDLDSESIAGRVGDGRTLGDPLLIDARGRPGQSDRVVDVLIGRGEVPVAQPEGASREGVAGS